jgi:hypothetical protein
MAVRLIEQDGNYRLEALDRAPSRPVRSLVTTGQAGNYAGAMPQR